MADRDDVADKILQEIERVLGIAGGNAVSKSRAVENLAEAWAWLIAPAQPHGGKAAQ